MVFFTCNHCGESAKKPSVAKHYQFKCRGAPIFVSCMDCQKDFKGEEYAAHTSCITEAEKYSGGDYVPKPSQNAGQRKQKSWLEIVRSILSTTEYDVTPDVRGIVQRLQQFDNVPRKREKFLNFVSNSLRLPKGKAEPVWQIVVKALEQFKASRPAPAQPKIEVDDAKTETNGGGESVEESTNVKKTKRKRKENGSVLETSENAEHSEESTKKKKKKNDESENGTQATTEVETPKQKKRSKHKEIELTNGTTEEESILENDSNKRTSETHQNDSIKDSSSPFDWSGIIFDILAKNNNEIELEKLKKKVLKKYKKRHEVEEIPWKVEKTFNKKLRKSGLVVNDNIVKTRA